MLSLALLHVVMKCHIMFFILLPHSFLQMLAIQTNLSMSSSFLFWLMFIYLESVWTYRYNKLNLMKTIAQCEKKTQKVKYWVDSVLNCNKYLNIVHWVLCTLRITYYDKPVGATHSFNVRHTVHMKYKKTFLQ